MKHTTINSDKAAWEFRKTSQPLLKSSIQQTLLRCASWLQEKCYQINPSFPKGNKPSFSNNSFIILSTDQCSHIISPKILSALPFKAGTYLSQAIYIQRFPIHTFPRFQILHCSHDKGEQEGVAGGADFPRPPKLRGASKSYEPFVIMLWILSLWL